MGIRHAPRSPGSAPLPTPGRAAALAAVVTALGVAIATLSAAGVAAAAPRAAAVSHRAGAGLAARRHPEPDRRPRHAPHDPRSARALLRIARAFNDDYQQNRDGAVYARWDARSRAIISRATYLRRHRSCPNTPKVKVLTWGVTRGTRGAWLVHYAIDGQQFTDWWYYVHGRFVFDLPRSNPSAVHLYEEPPAKYAKAAGCLH